MLAELLVSERPVVRNTAEQMLINAGWTETAIQEKITAALKDPDPARRKVAVERLSLANYQKRVLFEEIARLISDPDLTVRKQAVKGLSTLGFVPEEIYGQIQEQLLAEGKADAAVLSGLFAQMVQSDQKLLWY